MKKKPLVGIRLGSESDLPVMEKAEEILKEMGVPYEMEISSAHRLPEKTARYRVLLSRACISLVPASETDTCTRSFSEKILVIAGIFYAQGILWEESGDRDSALAAYSYGFGWLDAGVRSGLFRITGNRELFTI